MCDKVNNDIDDVDDDVDDAVDDDVDYDVDDDGWWIAMVKTESVMMIAKLKILKALMTKRK